MPARPHPPHPRDFLPLRPIELLVLTALAEGDLHGYAIRQAILASTGGEIEVEAGNLYRHLRRLRAERLVDDAPAPDSGDERRETLRLTPLGRRVLAAEVERLDELVRRARRLGIGRFPAREGA